MPKKTPQKNLIKFQTSCYGDNLAEVVRRVREAGIPEEEWKNLGFELDWGGCYYDGDTPSISLEGSITNRG